ncbi:hypothetical protein OG455_10055 [Kitasatospora sp. NBC_01287]|uniref:transmembrane-type terpene cyclase n=1 Tax=Kitasatospora sp. NBC_01287 TaxID=2903573 RepID=UPI00225088CD|nr:hypothetical protein [Kitasatospora sp. NBC_01287]MCX4745864.1 hypothetical protein [Kitasatospora sp. NBC_01287]
MSLVFALITGVAWTVAYVLAIRAGVRQRTYAMPVVALATNISWEFQFSFVRPDTGAQLVINILWFAFDCGLVYTALRYGPGEFPQLPPWAFRLGFVVLLALAYPGMDLVSTVLDGGSGALTAFASNVAMSGMFLAMLLARGGSRGQSLGIAGAKWLGTAAASVSFALDHAARPGYEGGLLPYCYAACFLLDLAYFVALATVLRRERAAGGVALAGRPAVAGEVPGKLPGEVAAA